MNRPLVLHVITSTGVGGAERALERCVLGLSQRYRMEVISLKEVGPIGERLRRAGVRVVGPMGRGALRPAAPCRLWREVGRRRPDLVHAWLFRASILARFAARMRGVPNLSAVRTLEMERTWQPRLDAATHRLVDRYLAVSEAAARFVSHAGVPRSKITVVPNGLGPEEFEEPPGWREERARLALPAGAFLLLCAGRLRWEKGQSYLLEALAREGDAGPKRFHLLVAGDGPDADALRGRARDLGLSGRVRFLGVVPDLRPLMRAADLLVLPSLWEGMPNVVLEAMAQGTPAVASGVGGVPEVVVDGVTGVLVPPRDPDRLLKALVRVREDPSLRAAMGAASRDRARTVFSLEKSLETTAAVYESVLRSRREG